MPHNRNGNNMMAEPKSIISIVISFESFSDSYGIREVLGSFWLHSTLYIVRSAEDTKCPCLCQIIVNSDGTQHETRLALREGQGYIIRMERMTSCLRPSSLLFSSCSSSSLEKINKQADAEEELWHVEEWQHPRRGASTTTDDVDVAPDAVLSSSSLSRRPASKKGGRSKQQTREGADDRDRSGPTPLYYGLIAVSGRHHISRRSSRRRILSIRPSGFELFTICRRFYPEEKKSRKKPRLTTWASRWRRILISTSRDDCDAQSIQKAARGADSLANSLRALTNGTKYGSEIDSRYAEKRKRWLIFFLLGRSV